MYKKILTVLICVFALFIVVGCNGEINEGNLIDEVADKLLVDVDKGNVTENLILPTKLDGVSITWKSSNESVISTDGVVTRKDSDYAVTLTATLKYGEEEKVVEIIIKVLGKEDAEENPGGENPGGENPGGENPGGENPGGENPGGENPGGGNTPEQGEFKGEFAIELFISEYYEGSKGNNKYIEIYNGTGKEVDLSQYKIVLYANGASEPNDYGVFNLSGKLSHNSVLVVYNSQADVTEIVGCGGVSASTGISFNGNDAVSLYKGDALIDVFGVIGNDPGNNVGWNVGSGSTCNSAIIRNSNVGYPNAKWNVDEWTYLGSDIVSNIGIHEMNFDGKVPEGNEGGEDNPSIEDVTKVSCKEANEIGSKLGADEETEVVYLISGVILEIYNDQYGNMYISDDEGVNKFNVYGVVDGETKFTGLNPLPKVGDTITVKGKIKNYKGTTVEIFNAQLVELKQSTSEDTPKPESGAKFSDFALSNFMTSGGNLKDVPQGWKISVSKGSYATKWQSFRNNGEYVQTVNFEAQNKVNVDFIWYLNNLADGSSKIKFEALDKDGNVVATVLSDELSLDSSGLGAENSHTLSVSLEGEGIVSIKISFEKSKGGNIAFSTVKLYN